MRRAALLLWLVLAAPATAQGLPSGISSADRSEIQDVIRRQLDAFQHDDAEAAYGFAAPAIRQIFPTPGIFMEMVRRGYAPVYRPRKAEFGDLALHDGELVQSVELVGPDGRPALALYTMERGADGRWVIAGCALVASPRAGA